MLGEEGVSLLPKNGNSRFGSIAELCDGVSCGVRGLMVYCGHLYMPETYKNVVGPA